jgi:hypothetical protein
MGALPHKTGGFRAYKKVGGHEFQYYSRNKLKADKKQGEYNQLSGLNSKNVFAPCGRLVGFRIRLRKRKGRTPYILVRKAVGPFREQEIEEWKYSGCFEYEWEKIKKAWAESHSLLPSDIIDYIDRIKVAKRLYINDVAASELKLNKIK